MHLREEVWCKRWWPTLKWFLQQDSTFEFERRRNRPERYNREVVEQTLKAIKKIEEVRVQRESKFWESRWVFFLNQIFLSKSFQNFLSIYSAAREPPCGLCTYTCQESLNTCFGNIPSGAPWFIFLTSDYNFHVGWKWLSTNLRLPMCGKNSKSNYCSLESKPGSTSRHTLAKAIAVLQICFWD